MSFEFLEGEGLALLLDTLGVAVASGSSCVSRSEKIPPALAAIGLDPALARGNVLATFGRDNTEADVDDAAGLFEKAVTRLHEMSPLWDEFQRGLVDSVIQPRAGRNCSVGAR
jgi:cysteine desulfurase